jgi:hypothetical protein
MALLEAAEAHAAVGHDRSVDLGPLGNPDLEDQPGADHDIVVVRRDEEPAFGRPAPVVE